MEKPDTNGCYPGKICTKCCKFKKTFLLRNSTHGPPANPIWEVISVKNNCCSKQCDRYLEKSFNQCELCPRIYWKKIYDKLEDYNYSILPVDSKYCTTCIVKLTAICNDCKYPYIRTYFSIDRCNKCALKSKKPNYIITPYEWKHEKNYYIGKGINNPYPCVDKDWGYDPHELGKELVKDLDHGLSENEVTNESGETNDNEYQESKEQLKEMDFQQFKRMVNN